MSREHERYRIQNVTTNPHHRHRAATVPLLTQAKTNIPPQQQHQPIDYAATLEQRHQTALSIWMATNNMGDPVGHALVEPVESTHPDYGQLTDPTQQHRISTGLAVELGALAIHPDHMGFGLGTRLTQARLDWANQQGYTLAVACSWNASTIGKHILTTHGFHCANTHGANGEYTVWVLALE